MTLIPFDRSVFFTIGCAAVVTYSLRLGGLLLAGRLPRFGGWKRFMDALPGAILLSLIAPGILSAGLWGVIGALATAFCAYRTRNVILSMLLGVAIVALHRQF